MKPRNTLRLRHVWFTRRSFAAVVHPLMRKVIIDTDIYADKPRVIKVHLTCTRADLDALMQLCYEDHINYVRSCYEAYRIPTRDPAFDTLQRPALADSTGVDAP